MTSTIFSNWDEAYKFAALYAHAFDGIDLLSNDTFRVRLEPIETAPVVPGKDLPVTSELPPGVEIVSTIEPQLPEHIEKIERALGQIRLPGGKRKWHEMSPWWRLQIARAYFFPKRQAVFRVGRRGGKSTSLCRVIVAETLFGDHNVPGGDVGVFAIISMDRENAKDRIDTCAKIITDLGIRCKATTTEIDVKELSRAIRVYTASVAGVSGFTAIGNCCDELSKWKDEKEGSNPAREVLASLRPTMATMPNARQWLISSPYSTIDAHYEAMKEGTTVSGQTVFYAPTWVANPTILEQKTRDDEEDEPTWEREYKAIPAAAEDDAFFPSDKIEAARIEKDWDIVPDTASIKSGADLGFRRNSTALVSLLGGQWEKDGKYVYDLLRSDEWVPKEKTLVPGVIFAEIAEILEDTGSISVCSDLHYIDAFAEVLEDNDLPLVEFPHDQFVEAYIKLRVLLSQGRIDLSKASDKLIRQLKQTRSRFTPTGMSVSNPEIRGAHGDLVSALVAAVYNIAIHQPSDPFGPRVFESDRSQGSNWHRYAWEIEDDY